VHVFNVELIVFSDEVVVILLIASARSALTLQRSLLSFLVVGESRGRASGLLELQGWGWE
jgi:hypothetical protein